MDKVGLSKAPFSRREIGPIIVFIFFFIYLFFQMQAVFLYFDDYGYLSLQYAYIVQGATGMNFSSAQLWEFLTGHYNIWGGRVLFFFFEIMSGHVGLWCMRLVQSLVTAGIFYVFFRIVTDNGNLPKTLTALITCLAYGLIEFYVAADGMYWFTASFLYLIPMLPIVIVSYFSYEYLMGERKKSVGKIIALVILAFIGGFSQEQLAVAFLVVLGIFFIYNLWKSKKLDKHNIWMIAILAGAIIGSIILLASPGSNARAIGTPDYYSIPLIERMMSGVENLFNLLFGEPLYLFMLFFIPMFILISIYMIKEKHGSKVFHFIVLVVSTVLFAIMLITGQGVVSAFSAKKISIGLIGIFVVLAVIQMVCYSRARKKTFLSIFFFAGLIATGGAIVAPGIAYRMVLPFMLFTIPVLAFSYVDLTCWIDCKLKGIGCKYAFVKYIFLVIFATVAASNMGTILLGYSSNAGVNQANDRLLREVSEEVALGKTPDRITLRKLKDDRYSNQQP
ncbi:MAG: DUF6056 family protein, partial [Christensenella sp.]|uniref:DUF6056 family protein n=1 Tax=Christensenella sp. TaxID=1935934 RepID=UPI002B1F7055